MTYEIYGTSNSYYKARVEGLASGVKVAWGLNYVSSSVAYLVLYVDLPMTQAPTLTITNYDNQGTIVIGPTHTGPDMASYVPRQYNVSMYNCVFLNGAVTRVDPNVKVFTYNMSGGGYNYLCTDTVLQQVRTYFDNYVPGQGVGEVTLQTEKPSQLLTFTSLKLGIALKYWVRGATLVEFPVSPVESTVKITKFQDQVYEDNEVFGERIAYYTIATTNVTVWFVYTNATLYDMRRILIGNIDRKYSSDYGLNSTAMTMTDVPGSEPPTASFGVYAYDERNTSPVITYTTKGVSMEVIGATLLSSNLREWRGGGSLQKMASLLLQDPGVYIVFASATIEGDSYGKYAYINDDTNDIILAEERNNCNYGWSSIELCTVIKTTAATTLSVYMNYSSSGYYSTYLMAVKLTGFYTKRTFTGTSGTSLAEVCNIAVGAGKYVVVANVTFDTTSGCSIYACVENGNNMFMADCGCNTNYYAPIINSKGYVEVPSSGTLSLKVKTSAANIDVSGYLAIVQVG